MKSTRDYKVKCHACGQDTGTIKVGNPKYWAVVAKMKSVRAHGGFSSSIDTGKIRTASIGGEEFHFIETEIEQDWPELAALFKREDGSLI